ncbi:uncharacterized protein LOC125235083 isoform X2 [Leguminivora glycinivorella]|uniref:uncharacterized protein LOC125235083 isoform X2 n=1 Tax=Leguminivora glycinivorella TaxID=1035111 RepID=UPI00200D08D5|nr:uncharacterized protein LOC125235083 isoform X2 [Leguminivora glycinivorella]
MTRVVILGVLMAAVTIVQCVLVPSVDRPDDHHHHVLRLLDDDDYPRSYRSRLKLQNSRPFLGGLGGAGLRILFRRVDDEYSAEPDSISRIGHKRYSVADAHINHLPGDI